jgi:hypothetical protein
MSSVVDYTQTEEYMYFSKHKKWNSPQDVQYIEDEFKKNPNFKPMYMCGFDGKPNGFIDNPYTMNFRARESMGLPPICPGFSSERDPNLPQYQFGGFIKK